MKKQGILIDLDGVIYNDNTPIGGAADTVRWLTENNIPFRFLTNTTMKSRSTLQKKLMMMGVEVGKESIFTAAYAASQYLRVQGSISCHLLLTDDAKSEFSGLESDAVKVDYVVAGDLGDAVTFQKLNEAFVRLYNGAKLIALQKNRYWLSDSGITLDAGAFVALLEFAANTQAKVIGKPSAEFFTQAIIDLHLNADQVIMIGDDIETDIAGGAAMGLFTCLVQTGKFNQRELERLSIQPDLILPSIAGLPFAGLF